MSGVAGYTFCITGKLENFATKAEAQQEIILRGGNASKSLTAACDFLVLGATGNENYAFGTKGTKQVLAEQWIRQGRAIKIITENQLIALIEAAAEVPASDRGQMDSPAAAPRHSAITRERIGDLECSWCFDEPRPEAQQILRITYESAPTPMDVAQEIRMVFQGLKSEAKWLGPRNTVRTELVPVGWSVQPEEGSEGVLDEDQFVVCARIVCLLENEPAKAAAREVAQEIRRGILGWGLGGRLSLRIWDAAYRYGRFWLNKLGR